MYNILSESIFKGNEDAAKLAGYIDLGIIINDVFSCDNLPQCCNKTGFYIKKADLVYSKKQPKNSFISLEKIIKNIYNCCGSFHPELCKVNSKSTYWINSGVIRPKSTIETISLKSIIKKVFKCCGIKNCDCGINGYAASGVSFTPGIVNNVKVYNADGLKVEEDNRSFTFNTLQDVADYFTNELGFPTTVSGTDLLYESNQMYNFDFWNGNTLLYVI